MDLNSRLLLLGAAGAGGAASNYWIATIVGNSLENGRGVAVDISGNVYMDGITSSTGAGSNDVFIAKYNISGTLQWQRTLGGASGDSGLSIAVDSSGNVYIAGFTSSTGAGGSDVLIAKYNTSGTLQWQRILGGTGFDVSNGIAVDSSGNVYIAGSTTSTGAGGNDVLIAKYDTSGTLQWQRTLGGASTDVSRGIAVDSSGNVYIAGSTTSTGAGGEDVLIAKYNTSGTLQWQRILGGASTDVSNGIAVDSSGNVYIVGNTTSDVLIAKYDTSGTLQWQRTLGGASSDTGQGIAVDSSGNVYIVGTTSSTGAGSNDFLIAKYNTSGTLQWQRTLGGTGSDSGFSIAVDSSGNVYIVGNTTSTGDLSGDFLISALPGDGSKTGTYGIFTYAVSTLTSATSTLTASTPSLTGQTSTLTSANSTLTDAASTLTSTTISL